MAPTRPLVAQQVQACLEIMAIDMHDVAEINGNITPSKRRTLWGERRLFFCTPQTMQNDIDSGMCEISRFVCVVFDEAHRAVGNYA